MFEQEQLWDLFQSLTPERQSQAIDFMTFLKQRQRKAEQSEPLESQSESHDPEDSNVKLKFGCMKGLVEYMADDFDAPLEDFAEYM